ncbi:ATP-dependent DNA helicase DinG [Gorillibacterium timonense]|uniref:ATP-dependent DNA helicase DinG n=1 Tax=Gorillibacterium timonense TaxID=1689269 RepID=UPI00071D0BF7|nr:ATP-dependent DNA helicase DinG [Gorillibacterium timonense]
MKFAVLDFETTGGQPADSIIQVGLVIIENEQIVSRYTSFVHPDVPIPPFIASLTGIDDELVREAPPLEQVVAEMQPYLQDSVLVAHNAGFDFAFLQRALEDCGYFKFNGMVLDTMDLARICFPTLPSLALGNLCESLNIPHDRPHRADSDAEATALLWLKSLSRFQELPLISVQRIASIFRDDPSDFAWFIDQQAALKERSVALDPDSGDYFRQFSLAAKDWGNDLLERDEAETARLLGMPFPEFYEGIKSTLQEKFAVFEERPAQDQMTEEVASAFDDSCHLLVEAGTGTGKSLGYLLPALYYGIREQKKVVVSTHTINLQEQLRSRDLPLLQDIFPVDFRAALLKGRSHYLCLRKYEQKLTYAEYEHGREDRIMAAQMVTWLTESEQGEDEELHFGKNGMEFWRSVSSDADSCLNRSCPWFKKCFYHRARNEAAEADLIITNHSLLFTDIKAEHRILPGFKHLVVDEAHNFEEVAVKHLGTEISWYSYVNAITQLFRDSRSGQLPFIRNRLLHAEDVSRDKAGAWIETIDELQPVLLDIRERWDELSALLYEILSFDGGDSGEGPLTRRIAKSPKPSGWGTLLDLEEELYARMTGSLRAIDKLIAEMKEQEEVLDLQGLVTNIAGSVKELYRHRDAVRFFLKQPDDNYVYWMEGTVQQKVKSLQLTAVPIDVSLLLRDSFFDVKESVILTSATLSVGKTFNYITEQLGLQKAAGESKLRTVLLPSPFRYREQALMVIPRNFPVLKGGKGEAEFTAALTDSLAEVAKAMEGRMLVLFTSYRMLRQVHGELKERLTTEGIQVLGQGIDSTSRSKLVRLFQGNGTSVLLGTSSFWEGVDIPGDALSCLAIVRLPFQPPNHPVVEAKSERIKEAGGNPFMKLSVPQAVIRFKQGFGRLVRTASDKGVVVVYDTRILETYYGKHFLYSLPGPKIEHMYVHQLVPRIHEWMEGEEEA